MALSDDPEKEQDILIQVKLKTFGRRRQVWRTVLEVNKILRTRFHDSTLMAIELPLSQAWTDPKQEEAINEALSK